MGTFPFSALCMAYEQFILSLHKTATRKKKRKNTDLAEKENEHSVKRAIEKSHLRGKVRAVSISAAYNYTGI